MQTKKINKQQQKKGRSNSFVDGVFFFVNLHWLSEFDQLMQAPMQYRRQFENTVVFLLVNKR